MTDTTNGAGNGAGPNGSSTPNGEEAQIGIQIAAQYIKDLSFENPSIERLLSGPGDNPNLNVEVNVSSQVMGENLYESTIQFTAQAVSAQGVIYELELDYAGLFHLENMPPDSLEPFLLINAPSLLFPFLRRLVADITREGGFPPLLLDPIDFASLYLQRQQEAVAGNDNT